jgi:hypothetical protein
MPLRRSVNATRKRHDGNRFSVSFPPKRESGIPRLPPGRPHTAFALVRRNALRLLRPTGLLHRPPMSRKHRDWPLPGKAAVAADILGPVLS